MPKHPVFIAVLFCLSACAGGREDTAGYGAMPRHSAQTIAAATGLSVAAVGEPQPYYARQDQTWLYGWRVCARLGREERLGYFLLRGDRIIDRAVEGDTGSVETIRARQNCSGFAAEDDAAAVELDPLRIEKEGG